LSSHPLAVWQELFLTVRTSPGRRPGRLAGNLPRQDPSPVADPVRLTGPFPSTVTGKAWCPSAKIMVAMNEIHVIVAEHGVLKIMVKVKIKVMANLLTEPKDRPLTSPASHIE
jgi:hypothetical protein